MANDPSVSDRHAMVAQDIFKDQYNVLERMAYAAKLVEQATIEVTEARKEREERKDDEPAEKRFYLARKALNKAKADYEDACARFM